MEDPFDVQQRVFESLFVAILKRKRNGLNFLVLKFWSWETLMMKGVSFLFFYLTVKRVIKPRLICKINVGGLTNIAL